MRLISALRSRSRAPRSEARHASLLGSVLALTRSALRAHLAFSCSLLEESAGAPNNAGGAGISCAAGRRSGGTAPASLAHPEATEACGSAAAHGLASAGGEGNTS